MFRTLPGRPALAGAALMLAVGLAACGGSDATDTASAVSANPTDVAPAAEAPSPAPVRQPEPEAAPPTAAAPRKTPPTTAARTTTPSTTRPAVASPATTAAPVTPTSAPGQRINPTTAQVQAAIASLSQRIPLFKPNESQLRTFADAACTSFDQGQTQAQVQATVQQAVTYVQGASLSAPDAEFAVRIVVTLRCPGYLP